MGDDTGSAIQNQNLIGDDVANEINQAMGEQMSGSVTPPTVVQPTSSQPMPDPIDTPEPEPAQVETPTPPVAPTASEIAEPVVTSPSTIDEPVMSTGNSVLDASGVQAGTGNFTELQDIKIQALQQLGPLVKHIDQDPEDRFNTLIMMIRASDDATLIQPAFDAAQAIEDDKKRAQALLDVVNEVNYLTRPSSSEDQK